MILANCIGIFRTLRVTARVERAKWFVQQIYGAKTSKLSVRYERKTGFGHRVLSIASSSFAITDIRGLCILEVIENRNLYYTVTQNSL